MLTNGMECAPYPGRLQIAQLERRRQNEKVAFVDNLFGVGNSHSCSSDGWGKYKYWHSSATPHHYSGASGSDRDA